MPTTIHLSDRLKKRLAARKAYPRETYADVVERALDALEEDDLDLSDDYKKKVARGREDMRAGDTLTTAELMRQLGL